MEAYDCVSVMELIDQYNTVFADRYGEYFISVESGMGDEDIANDIVSCLESGTPSKHVI